MTTRSRSKSVVFSHSFELTFELKGVDRILPPGEYQIVTDEERIEELSFPVYRRVATMIFVPAVHASSVEMVAIDPQELQVAQERDLPMTLSFRIQSRFKFNAACRPLLGHDSAMEASFSLGALFQFSGSFLVTAMNSSHPSATGTNAILG
jgi:hypothetical protein